jgi:hypothetical protein
MNKVRGCEEQSRAKGKEISHTRAQHIKERVKIFASFSKQLGLVVLFHFLSFI